MIKTITEDEWEVLIIGATYENADIFEKVAKIEVFRIESRITEKEADKMISDIEGEEGELALEISVIKKDNKHGHESYGWGDEDKIILWDSGGSAGNEMYTGNIHWCKNVAQLLCDSMNKNNM